MTEGEKSRAIADQELGTDVREEPGLWKNAELEKFTLETALQVSNDIPDEVKTSVATEVAKNIAWLSREEQQLVQAWLSFLPQINLKSLALGDEYVVVDPTNPDEAAGVAWMKKILAQKNTKEALTPLLDASYTQAMRDVEEGFAAFAQASVDAQRALYMPSMASAPWSWDQLQLTFSSFIVEPYTNIPNLQNNGRVPRGYGGSLGIQGQQDAFRYGAQLTGLATGQETDPTHKYNATAWFATWTIGVGTHAGNRLAANVDVGAGVGFSAVDGQFGRRKLDETNRFPVVTWNMSVDIQLFQRFMRERFKLSLGAWFIAPVGKNGDKFEAVPGNGPGGRWLIGIPSDLLLTYSVWLKFRLEPESRGGKRSKYF
jgi:hypothetical protein